MKLNKFILYLSIINFFFARCSNNEHQEIVQNDSIPTNKEKKTNSRIDTIIIKESSNVDDYVNNEYLMERLKPIRSNFKRINSIERWTRIDTIELWETTEGGEAHYYYQNQTLERIVIRHFGETFQSITEFYLLNGDLSFVFNKSFNYNRPFYYDSIHMRENKDSVVFNFENSEIVEERYYFEKGKLIHIISNQDCGSPFPDDFLLEEQNKIFPYFKKLISLNKKKL